MALIILLTRILTISRVAAVIILDKSSTDLWMESCKIPLNDSVVLCNDLPIEAEDCIFETDLML